ncbi:MAG: transglutaminase family protein [Planctomycetota bacterium]|nr:transglutaminase family protein [Planctomycetota bacterium]
MNITQTSAGRFVRINQAVDNGHQNRRTEIVWRGETVTMSRYLDGSVASVDELPREVLPDAEIWPLVLHAVGKHPLVTSITRSISRSPVPPLPLPNAEWLSVRLNGIEITCAANDAGTAVFAWFPDGTTARLVPQIPAEFEPTVLHRNGIVPVDRTIQQPEDLLRLTIVVPETPQVRKVAGGFEECGREYQDVHISVQGVVITLKAGFGTTFDMEVPFPLPAIPETISGYLGPSLLCESDDPAIVETAQMLVATHTSAAESAKALGEFVYQYLADDSASVTNASARYALRNGRGDCTAHAHLVIALARAAGIPARLAGGLLYDSTEEFGAIFAFHSWAELWLGKWTPVDATFGPRDFPARYLLLDYGHDSSDLGDGILRAHAWVWSSLGAKVLDYEYRR